MILVAGEALIDLLVSADGSIAAVPGGGPFNVARAVARLGCPSRFLGRLSTELTPEQVERVKDKLTYNVVHVTYDAYFEMLPQLTEPQKGRIMSMLNEAREEAMDGGTSEEKHAVFGRYKGRINNYLAKEGYDVKQASKELAEKLQARTKSDNPSEPASK